MNGYVGINGEARSLVGGCVGVNGVARKIVKGYVGVNGVARQIPMALEPKPVFSDNSWDTIIAVCRAGAVPDTWLVGDCKDMTVGENTCRIDIIGKNHDTYAAGGKAPLTLSLHDRTFTGQMATSSGYNSGGWLTSVFRTQKIPELMAMLPQNVRTAIKPVTKKYTAGDLSATVLTCTDTLFLVSYSEAFGTDDTSPGAPYLSKYEGEQYDYYKNADNRKKGGIWRGRSTAITGSCDWFTVSSNGNSGMRSGTANYGLPFAFCF